MVEVKNCLDKRGLTIQKSKECVKDRKEWKQTGGIRQHINNSE